MRDMLSNARSEYQAVTQVDSERQRVHQKTNEKLGEMISAQEELQKARAADVARGRVEAEELRDMLSTARSEHEALGKRHEELGHLHAEREGELSRTASLLKDMTFSQEQLKTAHAEDLERSRFEAAQMRDMLSNARSEYQAVTQVDSERQRVHQKTNEKLGELISVQEELQVARAADLEHGRLEAKELGDMLSTVRSEHAELGEKHEALRQVHAVMERDLSRTSRHLKDVSVSQEELQKARAADVERGRVEAEELRDMLSTARSEHEALGKKHEALSQAHAEQEQELSKTKSLLNDVSISQEELQKARAADVTRGRVEAEELRDKLFTARCEHEVLGKKHEELGQLHAEREGELSRTTSLLNDVSVSQEQRRHVEDELREMLFVARSEHQTLSEDYEVLRQVHEDRARDMKRSSSELTDMSLSQDELTAELSSLQQQCEEALSAAQDTKVSAQFKVSTMRKRAQFAISSMQAFCNMETEAAAAMQSSQSNQTNLLDEQSEQLEEQERVTERLRFLLDVEREDAAKQKASSLKEKNRLQTLLASEEASAQQSKEQCAVFKEAHTTELRVAQELKARAKCKIKAITSRAQTSMTQMEALCNTELQAVLEFQGKQQLGAGLLVSKFAAEQKTLAQLQALLLRQRSTLEDVLVKETSHHVGVVL